MLGLIIAALSILARMQRPTALGDGQNAGTPKAVVVAIYTDVGCICVKSWGGGKSYCLTP